MELDMAPYRPQLWDDRQSPGMLIGLPSKQKKLSYLYIHIYGGEHYLVDTIRTGAKKKEEKYI